VSPKHNVVNRLRRNMRIASGRLSLRRKLDLAYRSESSCSETWTKIVTINRLTPISNYSYSDNFRQLLFFREDIWDETRALYTNFNLFEFSWYILWALTCQHVNMKPNMAISVQHSVLIYVSLSYSRSCVRWFGRTWQKDKLLQPYTCHVTSCQPPFR
jgi:hypothetical protein